MCNVDCKKFMITQRPDHISKLSKLLIVRQPGGGHNILGGKGSLVLMERSDNREVPFSIKQSQMSSLSILELSQSYILMKILRGVVMG